MSEEALEIDESYSGLGASVIFSHRLHEWDFSSYNI